ncbi:CotH kinase family protein [Aureivirga sp. CE67]|uniref:CotH kinase family protein n=1 Tax=Aureivirga sp. CE67 TaxID=1788983 RepID=UPI0018C999A6|nr:CotH kinase family protein [Aureivirga sp. CE67]
MKINFFKTILLSLLFIACKKDDVEEIHPPVEPENIPVVNIETENNEPITSKDDYIRATFKIDDEVVGKSIKIRGRGNTTWALPKKPYQIKFDDKESVLEMPKDKKWVFLANYTDKSLLRSELAYNLGYMSNLDWTPESEFVDVNLNGEYVGIYQIVQKVEESSNRVDIGDDGYLLEVDQLSRIDADDVYFHSSISDYYFNIKEPKLDIEDEEYVFIKNYIEEFETLILNNDNPTLEDISRLIDLDSFIDWYLINEIGKNNDAIFYSSVYMNLIPGEKLKMGPIWDFDIAFGNINYNGNEKPEGFWVKNSKWYTKLFENQEFKTLVKNRFAYFYQNKNDVFDKVREKANYHLKGSVDRNFEKWDILGKYVWPNYVFFDTYEEEVKYLEKWYMDRMEWLNNNL